MITWKPASFYSTVNTRDCLLFPELKYEVVNATKVVGEHSHPNLGWEGSLTTDIYVGKKRGSPPGKSPTQFDMTIGVRDHAPT